MIIHFRGCQITVKNSQSLITLIITLVHTVICQYTFVHVSLLIFISKNVDEFEITTKTFLLSLYFPLFTFQRPSIIKSYPLDAVEETGKRVSTKCNLY